MQQQSQKNSLPDLVLTVCPLGCGVKCDKTWVNEQIGHNIVCFCTCHHKTKAPERLSTASSDAILDVGHSEVGFPHDHR